ncbi:peptidylprolyl isomerase [Gallaecimonas mangrovi]|uniref:peptidylprolyl isomerase n=1 Tax=Gallaecimonas mangrovi TaxID=2291597 RepID=UPI000E1FF0BB|nr:peptidylprolyl isomerase [Gallaecimonas mangrovi]
MRLLFLALLVISPALFAKTLMATISTDKGSMTFQLFDDVAPKTVAHFQKLANSGWYNGKTFYRVVKGHVIQAGSGDDNDPVTKNDTVPAEFSSKPHLKGTLGLARDEDPNSGSTEFYICDAVRSHLDGHYTVFGQLTQGEETLDAIANSQVKEEWLTYGDKKVAFHHPKVPIHILAIKVWQAD